MKWLPFSKLSELQLSNDMREHLECWALRDGAIYFSGGHKVRKANVATFEVINEVHSYLARDDSHVFHGWTLLTSVDRSSFEHMGDRYCRDINLAYFEYENALKPLKGDSVDEFQVLGCGYARDSSFGYFWGKPLKKCTSPMSLQIVESVDDETMDYAIDENHVYCEAAALKGVDVETWQPKGRGFSVDQHSVFYFADRIAKADVASWQHLASCYSRDQKHVFYMNRPLKEADGESFEVTPNGEARDRFGVFEGGSRLNDSSA